MLGAARITRRSALVGGGVLLAGLLGSGNAWAAPTAAPTARRAFDGPDVIDCASWGARPASAEVNVVPRRPVRILVHHTASDNVEDRSRDAAEGLARWIQGFHMDERGWLDSGQHFTISRGGYVLEGRHHSLDALHDGDRQVEGAHCTGQNLVAIGIENEGLYTDEEPPDALWERLREICAYVCDRYDIDPTQIDGHRDHKDTLCPGDVLYGMLPQLRSEVGDLLGHGGSEQRRAAWPLLRTGDDGPRVLAAQHLLRAAGFDLTPDGRFGAPTAEAVRTFQAAHGTEEVNGLVGGESWPLLVEPGPGHDEAEVAAAADALGGEPSDADGWRELLSDAG